MAIRLPKRGIGGFAQELIASASASQKERIQRGVVYRNLFLTGDSSGSPATYPKTNPYINTLASYLFSPVELRFTIDASEQPDEIAMARAATQRLHMEIRRSGVDMVVDEAVLWALVKGKSFVSLLWSNSGFDPTLIQPEMFGVLREDLTTLDEQEAFFRSIYLTKGKFGELIQGHPDAKELMTRALKYMNPSRDDAPDRNNMLKQVILGGLNPFQMAGSPAKQNQGIVDWIGASRPTFNPKVLDELVRLDELWVKDAERDDWTTIQTVGPDCVVEGKYLHRNIFADPGDITDKHLLEKSSENNPLAGHHPFIEFCANPLDGYFWGTSEINGTALLQESLNSRLNGIQSLLRRQEDPPRAFIGTSGVNQNAYAKLNKPGGFLTENSPNAKIETLAPDLPADLWTDLREILNFFDDMGGFTAVMQGRGESGVRSQAHSETLVRTASPRFKKKALRIERSVEAVGGLGLDILKAKVADKLAGWAKPGPPLPNAAPPQWWSRFLQAPAPGMQRIEFLMNQLPKHCKVTVDSHSSSPALSHEGRELAFALAKDGAIGAPDLIALTHPPHEEYLINEAERREIEKAQFMAQHPEIATKETKKKR
jgi:hypothetical protein